MEEPRGYRQYLRTVLANPIGGSSCTSFFDTQQIRRVVIISTANFTCYILIYLTLHSLFSARQRRDSA